MSRSKRIPATAVALLGLFLASGCGVDHERVVQEEATVTQSAGGTAYLTFSPQAAQRAAKLATIPAEGVTASRSFDDDGGTLVVEDNNGPAAGDDLKITFTISEEAADDLFDDNIQITMTVYGNTLSELVVAFTPGGLVFPIAVELKLELGSDLVDMSLATLKAIHTYHGREEPARITVIGGRVTTVIYISIPSFSRYGLRR